MADINTTFAVNADLDKGVKKTYLDAIFATDDDRAHQVNVRLMRGKQAAQLPEGTMVNAYFIRYGDYVTIPLTGEVSGNVASVTLKKSCYNKPGQFALIIKVAADGVTNTVFYGEGTIFVSSTDGILDEENVIPSLDDLLAQIDAMEQATEKANDAIKTAEAWAGATAAAQTLEPGAEAYVTITDKDGKRHIVFGIPQGRGVYVGSEEPDDPNIDIWIKEDGEDDEAILEERITQRVLSALPTWNGGEY